MKKLKYLILLILPIMLLTGCSDAETVSYNISKESDKFNVRRRITFINLRTGDYLFTMTGLCSIQGGSGSLNDELEVVCKIGNGEYQKHLLYLAEETTYVVEQLNSSDVSKYDYEFVFRPEAIVPIKIETEIGE